MFKWYVMLFLVGLSADAQQLELKIDSISIDDSDKAERVFNLHYHISNLTDEPLRFFLDTSNIIPSTGGSSSMYPFYMLYEGNTFLEIGSVFSGSGRRTYNLEKTNFDSLQTVIRQRKIDAIVKIAPKEVKKFTMDFHWNHERYYQYQDMEYYLEEKAQHFLEITMVLQKHIYQKELPEALFNEIKADNRFIEGVFTSNKFPIDFQKAKTNP